jgi:hypothetical protein
MASTLADFTLSGVAAPNDFIVGYDEAVLDGERRWTLSTIAKAVSGIMSTQLGNVFVEESNFTGANQEFTSTGHQKLPGGLIINWGSAGLTDQSSAIITYSMSFPNALLSVGAVAVTLNQDNWATVLISYVGDNSKNYIQLQREGNGVAGGSNACFFIAIGY